MANVVASVLPLHERAMPFLAHLGLRRRIIFSILGIPVGFLPCWSFADRRFGLICSNRSFKPYGTMASEGAWCT